MRPFLGLVCLSLGLLLDSQVKAGDEPALSSPAPSAVVVHAEIPSFGEGVAFDQQGRLFLSLPFAGQVLLVSPDGEFSVWSTSMVTPNGHKVLSDGRHVVMDRGPTDIEGDVGPCAMEMRTIPSPLYYDKRRLAALRLRPHLPSPFPCKRRAR